MTLIKWKPQPLSFVNNMDNMIHSILKNELNYQFRNNQEELPFVDIKETGDCFNIFVDIPGFKKSNLSVTLMERTLSISGKLSKPDAGTEHYHYRERRTGSFKRSFNLPIDINQNKISAMVENGILIINLPKLKEKVKKEKIININ